jgi:hypothetical protein
MRLQNKYVKHYVVVNIHVEYKQNEAFRKALHSTTGQLTHSIGRSNQSETVLTVSEFCGRLMKLRDNNGKL